MGRDRQRFLLALLASIIAASPVGAHHSLPALFDVSASVTVSGTVVRFEFEAPHSYILLDVPDEAGNQIRWQIETYPPGMLIRKRLTPATLAVGVAVSVQGHPSRDGRPLMRLLTITLPDGERRQIQ